MVRSDTATESQVVNFQAVIDVRLRVRSILERFRCSGESKKPLSHKPSSSKTDIQREKSSRKHKQHIHKNEELDLHESCDRVVRVFESLFLVFQNYKLFPSDVQFNSKALNDDELTDIVVGLFTLDRNCILEKSLKEFCAWPMARLIGADIPHYGYQALFGRSVRRIITSRIPSNGEYTEEHLSACQAILQMKRAFLPVSDQFVDKKLKEHAFGVGVEFKKIEPFEVRFKEEYKNTDVLIDNAIHQLSKYFNRRKNGVESNLNDYPIVPSTSSSYESNRAEGGFAGSVLRMAEQEYYGEISIPEPICFQEPYIHQETGEIYTYRKQCDIEVNENSLQRHMSRMSETARLMASEDIPIKAKIVAVKEPCKVRIVSCGETIRYIDAYRWDKIVRKIFKRSDKFSTLSSRIDGAKLTKVFRQGQIFWRKRGYNTDELQFLSGDYSAATDGIDPHRSIQLLNMLMDTVGLPEDQCENLRQCLINHEMIYSCDLSQCELAKRLDSNNNKHKYSVLQKRGQLMGSPVSFPILCLLNFVINWVFIDPKLSTNIDDVPILVNGDDLFMVIPRGYYDGTHNAWKNYPMQVGGTSWRNFIETVGFYESLGKNYISPRAFCINSQFYIIERNNTNTTLNKMPTFRYVDYARISLITGGGRVQNTVKSSDKYELSIYERLKLYQRSKHRGYYRFINDESLFNIWKDYNKEKLEFYNQYSSLSYRLPPCLGGLGGFRDYDNLTDYDKKFAGHILRDNININCNFTLASTSWDTRIPTKINEVLGELEGFEYRRANRVDDLFGSDFEEMGLTPHFLEKLIIVEQHFENRVDEDRYLMTQFRRYANKIKRIRKSFDKIKHSVKPISRSTYEHIWDFPLSQMWLLKEENSNTVLGMPSEDTDQEHVDVLNQ